MITREYVTILLVGSCFLLDYSSQIPLQAQLQSRTKGRLLSARGGTGSKSVRASLGEVISLEGRMRLRRHGRSRVQRIKRGWVWNQFFVLEEYMGSEPQYVGKVRKYSLLTFWYSTGLKCASFSTSFSANVQTTILCSIIKYQVPIYKRSIEKIKGMFVSQMYLLAVCVPRIEICKFLQDKILRKVFQPLTDGRFFWGFPTDRY